MPRRCWHSDPLHTDQPRPVSVIGKFEIKLQEVSLTVKWVWNVLGGRRRRQCKEDNENPGSVDKRNFPKMTTEKLKNWQGAVNLAHNYRQLRYQLKMSFPCELSNISRISAEQQALWRVKRAECHALFQENKRKKSTAHYVIGGSALVSVLNGRQTVSNNDDRSVLHRTFESILDKLLAFGVESTRCYSTIMGGNTRESYRQETLSDSC